VISQNKTIKKVFFLFGLILSIGSLTYILMDTPFSEFKEYLIQVDPIYFIVSVLINILGYFIHAKRWSYLFEVKYPLMPFYHAITIGNLANTILPSKSGEFIRPLILKNQLDVPYAKALGNCFIERVFDIFFGVTILVYSIYSLNLLNEFAVFKAGIIITLAAAIIFILLIIFLDKHKRERVIKVKIINQFITQLQIQSNSLIKSKRLVRVLSTTLLFWVAGVFINYFLLLASPLPLTVQTLGFAAFLGSAMGITLSLPSAPANIGVYNLTVILLVKMYLSQKGIQIDQVLEAKIVASSIIIHLGSITPDFIMGTISYFRVSKPN